ncbi:carboxylating nicotinate-nucleotide diphosphorylase [Candidatus Fermentibacteria bacterium]|nr:MAG: carboxylating nicotinate-nucleotide diphosphorylase [Candidatus Fermentibacteria bacterium]
MDRIDWSDPLSAGRFIVRNALAEDRVMDDVTTSSLSVHPGDSSICIAAAREELIVAGWFLVEQVFSELSILAGKSIQSIQSIIPDGYTASEGDSIGCLQGSADLLLRGERVALNLLCRLSGIATLTGKYVEAAAGTGVEILDTRKTTPCLRALEKYAVRTGGGVNHRFNLAELAMVKDNHIAVAGGSGKLHSVMLRIKEKGIPVEIEVDSIDQLKKVLDEKPDRILLDNMNPDTLRAAVRVASGSGVYLEASGGITLENLREVAGTGVDGISSGALTHSAPSADIGFDWGIR